ncbi:MAG: putative protein N(5)-glutamine methyltransferase [Leifsonia sp.]
MTAPLPPSAEAAIVLRLRAAGSVFAEDEAAILIEAAASAAVLDDMVERRVAGLPLEGIVGWAEFAGLRIHVDPGVFVPRRRSEIVVIEAERLGRGRSGVLVVDLCCGTGAIGVAIAARLPGVVLYAADIDPVEVACARRNVEPLGGVVLEGDLFSALPDALRGRVDLLVANAPYVPTEAIALMPPEARVHEPSVALDGGVDGLSVQRRVAAASTEWLAPGGHLLIETSVRQSPVTAAVLRSAGLVARIVHDDDLDGTVVIGRYGADES